MFISTVVLLAAAAFALIVAASFFKLARNIFSRFGGKADVKHSTAEYEKASDKARKPAEKMTSSLKEELSARRISDVYIHDDGNGVDLTADGVDKILASTSGLTEIEVRNRHLAGKEFRGFNIEVQEGRSVSLTYAGQVLATMDRICGNDGESVYHANTFPPSASGNLLPSDLRKMLDASGEISAVHDNPGMMFSRMCETMCEPSNIDFLRQDLSPKIQEMVAKRVYCKEVSKRIERGPGCQINR